MRSKIFLLAVVLGSGNLGCGTLFTDACRNMSEAPVRGLDDSRTRKDTCRAAREAWRNVERANPNQHFSADYAEGFKAGFADFLYEGGDGLPPAVPPFHYQLARYQTPEGHQAIVQWYAGFAEGSAQARASGEREKFVIPLSAPPINVIKDRRGGAAPYPASTEPMPEPPRQIGMVQHEPGPARLLRSAPPDLSDPVVEILPPRALALAPPSRRPQPADLEWRQTGE
jgi:hypothetical protein